MTAPNNRERILPRLIHEEIKESFINYSMSVIVSRALPDVRDGLKPVHRRVLYAMNELGLVPGRPYKKSATVVGDVLGKYHPHGDQSVYDALVRMVQDFSLRYPLVDGQGNFGSVDGDPAAAYRYTEARLTRIAMEMLADIDKNTVDFAPNFDDRLLEPKVLPSAIPNLVVNGSSGIAVGMATNIPPHNLREVVAALTALIDNPELTPTEIRKLIKGPDFPTGGYIYGRAGIKDYQETGRGRIVMRALFALVLGNQAAPSALFGMMLAILHYEWVHYVAHIPYVPRTRLGRLIKQYHLRHHFISEKHWFGVSNPALDGVFGTFRGPDASEKSATTRKLFS